MIDNIKKIIKDDSEAMFKNPIVVIVLIALIILPSLYSVINVYACWDPYGDTDNIDFIIVNNDNPVTVNGTTYSYGTQVIQSLQENNNFNWVYKDEDDARDMVKNGTSYAAIIIPPDFTKDVLSVYSGNPTQAQIEYLVNDKTSPVAPKITGNAATNVNTAVSDAIIEKFNTRTYGSTTQSPVAVQQTQVSQNATTQNATTQTATAQNAATGNVTNASTSNMTTAELTQASYNQKVSEYFNSPTELTNHTYYKADSYAQQVAPFYTALASWVGCIILIALLSVKPVKDEDKYSPIEVYFGKIGLFLGMNTCQSIVTFIGLCILGIPMSSGLTVLLVMLLIGWVFMTIVYTLVSLLGNIGKAIALIILVFQISGTNGIYPIEIMSPLFQGLMPYLPMTYAILLLKDAVFGVIWPTFIRNIGFLIIFLIAALAIGIIVKEKLDKRAKYFDKKLNESRLFELRK
ncbi:YhgE/Pip domain-containing protein [Candidatus Methanosphaera massiliense]|jgi:putative membrane protein|uniref:YhgE/Pip domain-containing protein n=1 Tax=Methanosphaera TaxID=2316 RepID=UPI0023802CC3|nr:YhgE/Pip family protein [Candidatus Methanosphaera massiliense]MDD6285406.1 YhgE/Pip family protein [Methanobacteriaceae archaeon]MDE4077460.1 YhgE/Pip family protein [Candidatus Methanosphaera massiliense]MDY2744311.1 YhgE/Pip family protein [Methanosphaera sp.]